MIIPQGVPPWRAILKEMSGFCLDRLPGEAGERLEMGGRGGEVGVLIQRKMLLSSESAFHDHYKQAHVFVHQCPPD